jgi:ribosomal protein S18 acetylase RimI-like enzyme
VAEDATRDVHVRAYTEADRDAVAALWTQVFADDPPRNAPERMIERKLAVQPDLFLVVVRGERVLGTVLGGYDGVRGWAYHLAVHPENRRAGLGRRLMQELEQRLRALGCPKLNLQIRAENAAVRAFYERLGYGVEARVSMGKLLG